jgi:hypothetical protein
MLFEANSQSLSDFLTLSEGKNTRRIVPPGGLPQFAAESSDYAGPLPRCILILRRVPKSFNCPRVNSQSLSDFLTLVSIKGCWGVMNY